MKDHPNIRCVETTVENKEERTFFVVHAIKEQRLYWMRGDIYCYQLKKSNMMMERLPTTKDWTWYYNFIYLKVNAIAKFLCDIRIHARSFCRRSRTRLTSYIGSSLFKRMSPSLAKSYLFASIYTILMEQQSLEYHSISFKNND